MFREQEREFSCGIFKTFFFLDWIFTLILLSFKTVVVAQLVRASDCDSEGRGFEPHHPPKKNPLQSGFFS